MDQMWDLVNELRRHDCTIATVKSILQSIPDVHSEINKVLLGGIIPLYEAIECRKSVQIIEELIIHGANVNTYNQYGMSPFYKSFETFFKTNDECCLVIIKLLLSYGVDINTELSSSLGSVLFKIMMLKSDDVLKRSMQMIVKHATNATKTIVLYHLFPEQSIYLDFCSNYERDFKQELKNSVQTAYILLEAGAHPDLDILNCLLKSHLVNIALLFPAKDYDLVMDLFRVVLQHIFVKFIGNDRNLMLFDVSKEFAYFWIQYWNPLNNKILSNVFLYELKKLWDVYFEQWKKMRSTLLKNKHSTLKVVRDLCVTNAAPVSSHIVYELLCKLIVQEFSRYEDIIRLAIMNSNIMDLYNLVWQKRLDKAKILHPDIFYIMKGYLTKEEILNYLQTLLPV